jgi:hypothetical protein
MRWALTSLLAAAALLPAAASAVPIPGAHYVGTTNQNYPISFDVSPDGTSLTNVVTTVNGTCGQSYSSNSTFLFPITGDTISGDDTEAFPYLKMRGSFTSPASASGTLDAFHPGSGPPVYCNALAVEWRARTTAGGGDLGGGIPEGEDPDEGLPGEGDPGSLLGPPAITITVPSGPKLRPSLKNGFVIAVGVDQTSTVAGKLILKARDAKRYGLGKKARVIASDRVENAGAETLLEFTFSKKVAKKLKKAKKLKLLLEVTATRADGVKGSGSETLSFK